MKKKLILTIIYGLTSLLAFSQNDKPERSGFTLKMPVDSVQFYEQEVKKTPYFVKDKIIQIYPTEKVFIEVETNKSEIISMKTVNENLNPEKTISVELTQSTKDKKHELMMFKITNPFNKQLEYKAMMYVVGHNKWIPTNMLPVKAIGTAYETWGETIITLVLSDWTLK